MVSPKVFIVAMAVLGVLVGRLTCSGSLVCLAKVCSGMAVSRAVLMGWIFFG